VNGRGASEKAAPDGIDRSRRRLLIGGLTAGGGFLLGLPAWSLDDAASGAAGAGGGQIGFFVEIRPDNSVVIGVAQPEIGQGVRTSMPMLVAEELDVEWSAVSVRQMPLGIVKTADGFTWRYGGQGAGGSTSVSEMKLTSTVTNDGGSRNRAGETVRMSVASSEVTARCSRRLGCSCPRPTSTA